MSTTSALLESCKNKLRIVGLVYDRSTPNLVVQFSCLFSYFLTYGPLFVFLVDRGFDLSHINNALYTTISASLFLIIYIDFIWNNVHIQRTLEHLAGVVFRSE